MMDRVLQSVSDSGGLRIKMDALVQDLTQALEETSCANGGGVNNRVKTGFRRRTRSAGNLSALLANRSTHLSDDSAVEKVTQRSKEFSSFVQSDSDEMSATSQHYRIIPYSITKRTRIPPSPINIESDSVNENFSPLLRTGRRKRKMKRIDIDAMELGPPRLMEPRLRALPVVAPIRSTALISLPGPSGVHIVSATGTRRKKPAALGKESSERMEAIMGKRKRGCRDRDGAMAASDITRPCCNCLLQSTTNASKRCLHIHLQRRKYSSTHPDSMELDRELMSSSSLSSSESDPGLYTNDEGREGDDEQSDWFGDSRLDGAETDVEHDNNPLQKLLSSSLDQMTSQAREAYQKRISWLQNEGLGAGNGSRRGGRCGGRQAVGEEVVGTEEGTGSGSGLEIRGGRRRVRNERSAMSVLTTANEKLSTFLQDTQQLTLRLHPMDVDEREQLVQLVNMYSLQMRVEVSADGETCPVLSKTSATPHASSFPSGPPNSLLLHHAFDYKKRRKMPHSGQVPAESDMDIT